MTALLLRLNGLVMPAKLCEGELDEGKEKREVNQLLGWATWNSRRKLSKQRNRAKAEDWVLAEKVESLMQHLDGTRCCDHHAIIDPEHVKSCCSQADQSRNLGLLSLASKQHFAFGKVRLCQMLGDAQHEQRWGRHGDTLIKVAAGAAICKDAATKMALFAPCTVASIPVLVLKCLMDCAVLKTFHA
jgi:hypothetical protein